jgi:hypothetical protein
LGTDNSIVVPMPRSIAPYKRIRRESRYLEGIRMKKSYYLSILLLLTSFSMVLNASSQEQATQTVYVYDENFNGTPLSDVQVSGQDAVGNSFEGITDANGAVVLYGQPGTWHLVFTNEGYGPLDLNYDVIETGEGAVYLKRSSSSLSQPPDLSYH